MFGSQGMAQQNKKTRLVVVFLVRFFTDSTMVNHHYDHFLYSSLLFASYYTAGQEMGEDYHSESLLCAVTEHEILGFKLVWVPLADFVGKWLMRAMMPCFWAEPPCLATAKAGQSQHGSFCWKHLTHIYHITGTYPRIVL